MKNQELKEIVIRAQKGAASAYDRGYFRFSLIGYGAALEGLLIDWLSTETGAQLNSAIASASPTFYAYEDRNDPHTWRLANLIKVGRKMP